MINVAVNCFTKFCHRSCMAGMTVTPERAESINFTDSYCTGVQSIIVLK